MVKLCFFMLNYVKYAVAILAPDWLHPLLWVSSVLWRLRRRRWRPSRPAQGPAPSVSLPTNQVESAGTQAEPDTSCISRNVEVEGPVPEGGGGTMGGDGLVVWPKSPGQCRLARKHVKRHGSMRSGNYTAGRDRLAANKKSGRRRTSQRSVEGHAKSHCLPPGAAA